MEARGVGMAEREGFEPPIRLPVCRISSAVHSTTLPPLQCFEIYSVFGSTQSLLQPLLPKLLPNASIFNLEAFSSDPKCRIESLCCVSLHIVGNVRIQVHRRRDSRVTKALLSDFRMDAASEQLSGVRVPQVVEPHRRHVLHPASQESEQMSDASRLQSLTIGAATGESLTGLPNAQCEQFLSLVAL